MNHSGFVQRILLPARRIKQLLLPEGCTLCGDPLFMNCDTRWPLCRRCSNLAPIAEGPRCRRCSLPLISEFGECTRCRNRSFHFERNTSVFRYDGPAGEVVRAFKFRRVASFAALFAQFLADCCARHGIRGVVVPAPSRPAAVRKRGFDPVALVARTLERNYRIPSCRLLTRRGGKPQKTLSYAGRLTNLSGTIRLRRGKTVPARIILLDDVFTTGATADECSRVLTRAGARRVEVVTIALD